MIGFKIDTYMSSKYFESSMKFYMTKHYAKLCNRPGLELWLKPSWPCYKEPELTLSKYGILLHFNIFGLFKENMITSGSE